MRQRLAHRLVMFLLNLEQMPTLYIDFCPQTIVLERWTFGANDGVPIMVGGNLGICRPVTLLILPPAVVGLSLWVRQHLVMRFEKTFRALVKGGHTITGAE